MLPDIQHGHLISLRGQRPREGTPDPAAPTDHDGLCVHPSISPGGAFALYDSYGIIRPAADSRNTSRPGMFPPGQKRPAAR